MNTDLNNTLSAVIQLAEACKSYDPHTKSVTQLALKIFDALKILHRLENRERFWLESAAILHNIGSIEGKKEHHKASLRIILSNTFLPFDNKERLIIASIARYHRKALPDSRHDHFAVLDSNEQEIVSILSSILRQADGIIQCLQSPLNNVKIKVKIKIITISCHISKKPESDRSAHENSDLMEIVFNRKIDILWKE